MPRIELELNDQNDLIPEKVPAELDAILKRIEAAAHGQGYGKGVQKAAEEAKKQIADTVALELAKKEAMLPVERAKWQQIEEDNKALQARVLDGDREHRETVKAREEAHAKELLDRAERLKKATEVVRLLTKERLRAEALALGARDESLDELEVILHASIGYNDDMQPVVLNPDGTEKLVHGKPVTLSSFVKDYLDTHTHHRRASTGTGTGARGGATFRSQSAPVSFDAAKKRIESEGLSNDAINQLFEATRKKTG